MQTWYQETVQGLGFEPQRLPMTGVRLSGSEGQTKTFTGVVTAWRFCESVK